MDFSAASSDSSGGDSIFDGWGDVLKYGATRAIDSQFETVPSPTDNQTTEQKETPYYQTSDGKYQRAGTLPMVSDIWANFSTAEKAIVGGGLGILALIVVREVL